MKVVSNSSPLIILARIERFDLLREIFSEITIPDAVYAEVVVKGKGHPGSIEVKNSNWIKKEEIVGMEFSKYLQNAFSLGSGEAESIVLAKELSADLLLMDDRRARLAAISEGIGIMGTVGIIEACYEKKLITDLSTIYQGMSNKGIRIGEDLLNNSLKKFGLERI